MANKPGYRLAEQLRQEADRRQKNNPVIAHELRGRASEVHLAQDHLDASKRSKT